MKENHEKEKERERENMRACTEKNTNYEVPINF